ncbi:S-Ena type endospore appendage [Mangrovibacillus cuniculi]|uniref:Endospore appendages core domain-containing protein n=1 Tax=Mangrovibacillus cuniculi TaxID=2593652 RepID=A0A7S8CE54_9BACI|nr:S-Ena type endospore appendage [Mangrovibacillus cuniculi]QPC48267.1 hypothetical protein G8O30_15735 [Mangrovibacillus cuniculi]
MNIYQNEGEHCGCKDHCSCKKKNHHHYGYELVKKDFFDESCPDKVKGYNLCKKRNELRCFKQCQPISQPCGTEETAESFNYFSNRTNYDFSGLIVVTNTGNAATGCTIEVQVIDRLSANGGGTANIEVSPEASVPIFVEGLVSLDIRCISSATTTPIPATCSGEILFDLEYCATKLCR